MKFIVLFEDATGAEPDIRKKHMQDHLAFLERNRVLAAGPLADPEAKGRDGLWIVDAPNAATVDRLVKGDPFWSTGLRASYVIIPWTQVFADGRRQVDA